MCVGTSSPLAFVLHGAARPAEGRPELYSHGDGDVTTLFFCSSEADGEGRLDLLHLVDELDPELVMVDCRMGTRNMKTDQCAGLQVPCRLSSLGSLTGRRWAAYVCKASASASSGRASCWRRCEPC